MNRTSERGKLRTGRVQGLVQGHRAGRVSHSQDNCSAHLRPHPAVSWAPAEGIYPLSGLGRGHLVSPEHRPGQEEQVPRRCHKYTLEFPAGGGGKQPLETSRSALLPDTWDYGTCPSAIGVFPLASCPPGLSHAVTRGRIFFLFILNSSAFCVYVRFPYPFIPRRDHRE